jgi:hypothetical protein
VVVRFLTLNEAGRERDLCDSVSTEHCPPRSHSYAWSVSAAGAWSRRSASSHRCRSGRDAIEMEELEARQRLTVVRSLWGQSCYSGEELTADKNCLRALGASKNVIARQICSSCRLLVRRKFFQLCVLHKQFKNISWHRACSS